MPYSAIEAELGNELPRVEGGDVIPIGRSRLRSWLPLAAAAAIAIIAGAALVLRGDDVQQVALVELDSLTNEGSATAELVRDDGRLELRVDVEGQVRPEDGFLELWLINGEITELISLGPLQPDGRYLLPPGVDPAAFPVVDVSIEPLDGDPTHSGQSVFRGQFAL